MAIRQALTAMDGVVRENARVVGLEGADVLMVLLLGQRESFAGSSLALFTGRTRQQVQRSLMVLRKKGLVRACRMPSGRAIAWALTDAGVTVKDRLEARFDAWEEILGGQADLPKVAEALECMVESLVNRPSSFGWRGGLQVPHVSRLNPAWDRDTTTDPEAWRVLSEPLLPGEFEPCHPR
jgi:hypothetical protein